MTKVLSNLMNKDLRLATILGMVSVVAIYIAQASSNSCIVFAFEQPKIPKTLIKQD